MGRLWREPGFRVEALVRRRTVSHFYGLLHTSRAVAPIRSSWPNSDHPTRGCVTPLQIASIKDATEDDLDMLDGYEELPDDLQEKVKQSIENGHVSDEDWRGVRSS